MPPSGSRNGASNDAASEQSSMGATTSTSPQISTSKGNGRAKRSVDTNTQEPSSLRRSKRLKSDEGPKVSTSPLPAKSGVNGRSPGSEKEKNSNTPVINSQEDTAVISLKQEVKKEGEEKEELSATTPVKPSRKRGVGVAKPRPVEVDEKVEEEKEEDTKKIVSKKTSTTRKRTTKKKQEELLLMPLAARTQGLRMFVGAHVSAAKGLFNAVNNSAHIGGNAFALFLKSQRKWDNPPLQDDHRDEFRRLCREQKYDASKYILPHGSYLVNLAQQDKAKAKQAYDSFLDDLRRCEALGISLYNFHPGSANQAILDDALSRLAEALTNALSATSTVVPVLETMCGHGTTIGGSFTDFRSLLRLIPQKYHSRIGICIDTCHSFAAGYDLASPTGFKEFMAEFEDVVGIQYLRALHLNDSRAPRGSKRDLHANIGTGFLGLRAFHNVMNEPRFEGLPMILETPIDRPVEELKKDLTVTHGEDASDTGNDSDSNAETKSQKKKKTTKKKAPATTTIPDPGVWAREIKLLESLIGMDPEGQEFKALEAQLADEGREMRLKYQEQYERKLEAEEKKKTKIKAKAKGGAAPAAAAAAKDQKTLLDMVKASSGKKTRRTSRKKQGEGSADEAEDE